MKKPSEPEFVTAEEAKTLLGVTTREGVLYMIKAGQLPGARKVSENRNAPWIIPFPSIKAHPNYTENKKRSQAAKAT